MWTEVIHPFLNFNSWTMIPPKNSTNAQGDEWWSANALIYLTAYQILSSQFLYNDTYYIHM